MNLLAAAWRLSLPGTLLLLVSIFTSTVLTLAGSSQCYYPDGSVSQGDAPCEPDQDVSWCCGATYECTSNQLCAVFFDGAWEFNRGTCTDSTWSDDNCPRFCDAGMLG